MLTTTFNSASRTSAGPLSFVRIATWSLTVALPLMLLLLVARRFAGGLEALPGAVLCSVGIVAALVAVLWRRLWRQVGGGARRCERIYPAICLALLATALTIRGTHPLALLLFWGFIVGEELWSDWPSGRNRLAPIAPPPRTDGDVEQAAEGQRLASGVSQQLTRTTRQDGETLLYVVRARFDAGQLHDIVHIAFCPPMIQLPSVTIDQLEGPSCRIKLGAVETYGARLEVMRHGALDLADEVVLRLRAMTH